MKQSKVNEKLLKEKLAELEKAQKWSPLAISSLEKFLHTEHENLLFRINPIKFAKMNHLENREVIELFLHGTKLGLFRLDWQLLCPMCSCVVKSFSSLKGVDNHYHCTLCQSDYEAALDDYIEVTFTVIPEIRDIIFHHPEELTPEQYVLNYCFTEEGLMADGTPYVNAVESISRSISYILPEETITMEVTAEAERPLLLINVLTDALFLANVGETPAKETQHVAVNFNLDNFSPANSELAPGNVIVKIKNTTKAKGLLGIFSLPTGFKREALNFVSFLSGKTLLNTQLFRDLFFSETIQATEGIGIKSLTVLFTDLKGSTALYEKIGDLKAYSLVRLHFARASSAISRNGGAIVKTIGDAVMATFSEPVDAVKASLEMLHEIELLNQSLAQKEIILKLGIHKGHSIAVTSNDRLDYFGQSINLASRVQDLADANEIYITRDIYDAPGVAEVLKGHEVEHKKVRLKGILEEISVYRIPPVGEPTQVA